MKNLSDILPIYGAEQELLLSKRGDLTATYAVGLPEIFTLSSPEHETLHQTWVRALKLLPEGCILHKQDWFVSARYAGDFTQEHDFLSHSSERFFHERPYLEHSCYLMLTLRVGKPVTSLYSSLLRKHIIPAEMRDPAFAKSFESVCAQFIRVLADSGLVSVKRLNDAELAQLVNRYLLLGEDGVLRDIDFDNGLRVGEKHCELFTLGCLEDLPALCGARIDFDKYSTEGNKFPVGFVTALGQLLPCDHIYNQYIVIENGAAVAKQLEKRKQRLQSLSLYARENAFAKESIELFLNESVADGKQIVRVHCNVLAWTPEPAALREVRNACISALSAIDARVRIETVGAPQLYWAGIPGNAGDLPVNETWLSFATVACCFLNNETNYRSSVSPFGIRLGERISGIPKHIDITDEPMRQGIIANRNKIVIGGSGTGKSFLVNHMLHAYFALGAHVVIVDVGHSYRNLCKLTGGYYYTYSEDQPISLNPFYIAEGAEPDTEKKESIKTLLLTLWKRENEPFSRSEYVALSDALQGYYNQPTAFRSFDSFYEYVRDEFAGVLVREMVRDQQFDVKSFLYVLRPYYKGGEFDYLLNASANIDMLDQRFIVFELDNIKDHPILFPVVTIVIMELFIAKMRRLRGVRKMMVIEEAWKAIAKNGMAEYIKYLFKTARKYFGEAVVVTQEIEDILSSEIIKQAIINNADCKILLDQSKYQNRFEEIRQLLGLSEKEAALVLSMNRANEQGRTYKEVFISLGGRVARVYRAEVSPEEYHAYTTEEKEKLQVELAAQRCGSIEAGIQSILYA